MSEAPTIDQRIERREQTLLALHADRAKLLRELAKSDDPALDIRLSEIEDSIASCERLIGVLQDQREADIRERRELALQDAKRATGTQRQKLVDGARKRTKVARDLDNAAAAFVKALVAYRQLGEQVRLDMDQVLRKLPGDREVQLDRSLIWMPLAGGTDSNHAVALARTVAQMVKALDAEGFRKPIRIEPIEGPDTFEVCAAYAADKIAGFASTLH